MHTKFSSKYLLNTFLEKSDRSFFLFLFWISLNRFNYFKPWHLDKILGVFNDLVVAIFVYYTIQNTIFSEQFALYKMHCLHIWNEILNSLIFIHLQFSALIFAISDSNMWEILQWPSPWIKLYYLYCVKWIQNNNHSINSLYDVQWSTVSVVLCGSALNCKWFIICSIVYH